MEEYDKKLIKTIEYFGGILGRDIDAPKLAGLGANSRIYKIDNGTNFFALKFFRQSGESDNSRLNHEVMALNFFSKRNIHNVPKLYGISKESNCSLNEWISGDSAEYSVNSGIDHLSAFLLEINDASSDDDLREHKKAIEACLSPQDIIQQINKRLEVHLANDCMDSSIRNFLDGDILPFFNQNLETINSKYIQNGMNIVDEIQLSEQILSPVDFGFHNILINKHNAPVFIDFEFFGRDDPVKLISDLILHPHPKMQISNDDKLSLKEDCFKIYRDKDIEFLEFRFNSLFNLYLMRWIMIMMNIYDENYMFNGTREELLVLRKKKITEIKNYFEKNQFFLRKFIQKNING